MIVIMIFFFSIPLHFIYNIKFSNLIYFENLEIILAVIGTLDILVNLNTAKFQKGTILRKRALIFLEFFSKDGFINLLFIILLWKVVVD